MPEFLKRVRKQGDVARKFVTRLRARAMDAELNERIEKMERTQRELQEGTYGLGATSCTTYSSRARIFVLNPGANPSDPIVPDLDDPVEITRLKIDDHDAQDNAKELSLVPDLVLPPKFKVSDFGKYDGTRCPKAHLVMFRRKMTGYVNEDKLLIHCF
ncbi:hypothetical protein Goshw_009555 [Gossypium schwendimanii]|uniref:Uncharacterized protein n=1 Tax=Gossypium schwendimanii TaxID=34291 RepID=A0A7J9MS36_GOSSC|nr:hypothetical protein [Gossypium schwendimanii]